MLRIVVLTTIFTGGSAWSAQEMERSPTAAPIVPYSIQRLQESSPPRVEIVRPPYGELFGSTTQDGTYVRIRAEVEDADADLAEVRFFADTELIGILTNAPFTLVWHARKTLTGVFPIYQEYALRALAIDRSGLSATSAPVKLYVGGVSQTEIFHELVTPAQDALLAEGATFEFVAEALVAITGQGEISMEFYIDSDLLETVVQPAPTRYPFAIAVTNLPLGDHVLRAVFRQAGLTSWNRQTVTVHVVKVGLRGVSLTTEGSARLAGVTAYPGARHNILASSDLLNWTHIGSIVPSTNDFEFLDATSRHSPWRYYRVVALP